MFKDTWEEKVQEDPEGPPKKYYTYRHGKITEVGRTEFQDHDTGEKGKATSFYSIIDDDGNYQPGKAQDVVEREKKSKNVKR